MYIPSSFQEADRPTLYDFIERNSFGVLVSQHCDVPFATHLPFLLDRDAGQFGTLVGHMARANPHWKQATGQNVLVIFSGPHAYISPTWYEAAHVVPTWNYVAVHAYGTLRLIEEPDSVLEIVRSSVEYYERTMPRPWTLDESPTFIDRLLTQIVGFRIAIERIEGKWKLNQNHPAERRARVVNALSARGDENATAIAELMRRQMSTGEGR